MLIGSKEAKIHEPQEPLNALLLKKGQPKGDRPMGTDPNLRFPAVFWENHRFSLQKSVNFCGVLRPPNA